MKHEVRLTKTNIELYPCPVNLWECSCKAYFYVPNYQEPKQCPYSETEAPHAAAPAAAEPLTAAQVERKNRGPRCICPANWKFPGDHGIDCPENPNFVAS